MKREQEKERSVIFTNFLAGGDRNSGVTSVPFPINIFVIYRLTLEDDVIELKLSKLT